MHKFRFLFLIVLMLAACSRPVAQPPLGPVATAPPRIPTGNAPVGGGGPPVATVSIATASVTQAPVGDGILAIDAALDLPLFGYTHQQPNGNRLVGGQGHIPGATFVDVPLGGVPRWVVAAPANNSGGVLWLVALADGSLQTFSIQAGVVAEVAAEPASLAAGQPPLLQIAESGAGVLALPDLNASPATHPVAIPELGYLAYVDGSTGEVVILVADDGSEVARLAADALPDARLLVDGAGNLLLLTNPTGRYDHGIAGDATEAGGVTLIELQPVPRIALHIPIAAPLVIEGIAPIWADLTGDGQAEIVVTVSGEGQGGQLVVFDSAGNRIASGSTLGQSYRWRHQIAAGPFGSNGEMELVDVVRPHLDATLTFYQMRGDSLVTVAELAGFPSHQIYSRNLDMAAGGDFDGDGSIEVLLPTGDYRELGGVRRTASGAEVVWTLPLDGQLTTNIGAVTLPDGRIAVGVGTDGQVLRVWGP